MQKKRSLIVRILAIVIALLLAASMLITVLPSFVFGLDTESGRPPLVIDDADLLSDSEERELEDGLLKFRDEQDFDIVVVTVRSLDGYDVVDYADIFYDQGGYGGGSEYDGALILVSTEYRDWTMITSGYGITAITDYSLDNMEDKILPDLSAGNYLRAFETFADECAYLVREARSGNIIDEWIEDSEPGAKPEEKSYPVAANVGAAGIFGILVSWFTTSRQKARHKSVRYKSQARDYVRRDSLRLTENRDRFLYKTVNRVPIRRAENNSSGGHFGGSTIHISPGGGMHGGGHAGKF